MAMQIRPEPCPTCPYRVETPPGVWDGSEYAKLPEYDRPTGEQPAAVFLCHDGDGATVLCRGWVDCHNARPGCELLSVRLACCSGRLDPEALRVDPSVVPLHASGQAACDAGLAGVSNPSPQALRAIRKLSSTKGGE